MEFFKRSPSYVGMATGRVFSGTRPAPPLMGWDKNVLNGFGTGMGFFLKPGAGSGIVSSRLYIKLNLKFKINLI